MIPCITGPTPELHSGSNTRPDEYRQVVLAQTAAYCGH